MFTTIAHCTTTGRGTVVLHTPCQPHTASLSHLNPHPLFYQRGPSRLPVLEPHDAVQTLHHRTTSQLPCCLPCVLSKQLLCLGTSSWQGRVPLLTMKCVNHERPARRTHEFWLLSSFSRSFQSPSLCSA